MCVAIVKPAGTKISLDTLRNCWNANPDGAGYCFAKEGVMQVHKFMSFETFYEAFVYDDTNHGDITDFLIHFRITSRGATRIDNCHPFLVNDKMAFIHNGTITAMPIDKDHQHSDTYLFNELILKHLPSDWDVNAGIHYLIEDFIGAGSKIAVLHTDRGYTIYNEEKGVWDSGIWYSNYTYKRSTYIYSASNYYSNYRHDVPKYDYKDWDHTIETIDEYKERIDKERASESGKKALVVVNGNKHDEKKKEEEKKSVEETGELVLIKCKVCDEFVDIEDIFTLANVINGIDFVCEDCCINMENSGIEPNIVNLSQSEYEFYIEVELESYESEFPNTHAI